MVTQPQLQPDAPWKKRFHAPAIQWTQLAWNNPRRGIVASNQSGNYQLYAWKVAGGTVKQLTNRREGMIAGTISPDGKHIYYLDDQQGNEIGHYVRIPFEGGEPEDISPAMPPYASWGFAFSRAGNRLGFMAAGEEGFYFYSMDVAADGSLGPPRKLYHSQKLALGPFFSSQGEVMAIMSSERFDKPQFSLIAIDANTGEQIAELYESQEISYEVMAASPLPGDVRFLAATNRTGIETLFLWEPRSNRTTDLIFEGVSGSARAFDWSPDGERILFRTFNQAVQQLYIYHLPSGKVTKVKHMGVNVSPYFGSDQEVWTHWQDPTLPPRLVSIDAVSGEQGRTLLEAGQVPPGHPWKSVIFKSSDGQDVQAWLGLPDGDAPFPLILETHGGPEAVTSLAFAPESQAWLDHGFAYLSANYRGSTTFGREFQEKIWGNPGHWEVEDMAAAYAWLVKEGIAYPNQVFLTGWSYGGYLTLQALGKRPDLWAGGMAGVAITDWAILYEDAAETLKAYDVALFGGKPEEKPEQYATSSPITYAENVKAPVLIIQGRNDTRTPARPVEMYEQRLKALGKPIEVQWFDAGHVGPFAQVDQSIQHMEIMLRFVNRVLRVQQLAGLFQETIQAHHQAFIETDGYHPEWAEWYADYLLAPLSQLFDRKFSKSDISAILIQLDQEQRQKAPTADWREYYARSFVERFA